MGLRRSDLAPSVGQIEEPQEEEGRHAQPFTVSHPIVIGVGDERAEERQHKTANSDSLPLGHWLPSFSRLRQRERTRMAIKGIRISPHRWALLWSDSDRLVEGDPLGASDSPVSSRLARQDNYLAIFPGKVDRGAELLEPPWV